VSGAEERLYGLMEIVEQQQAAVQRALNGLAEERAALAQERQRLADEASGLEERVREAVSAAVTTALEQVGKEGVATVREATKPLLEDVAGLAGGMAVAEEALRRIVAWASWRLLGWIVALTVGLMLFGWLSSTALVWWDRTTVSQLRGEIAMLQANHAAWVKAGMLDKITYCEPGNRPCVAINQSAGTYGKNREYRVLKGY
jgi:AcrR family transcriptional regulator